MSKDPFSAALRAELDAVVARYEALARTHHETLAAVREQETAKLRADTAGLVSDRERARAQEGELKARLAQALARIESTERELAQAKEAAERERRAAEELGHKASAAVTEAAAGLSREQAAAAARLEAAKAEAREGLLRERKAHKEEIGRLEAEREALTARVAELEGELGAARDAAESLGEAFSQERAFVSAGAGLAGTALAEALRGAMGAELSASPGCYAALKARRPDVILTAAVKERGRLVLSSPLAEREATALRGLAAAAGCEIIAPEPGARFSGQSMDKASVVVDPAEEGNVVECLMPGLRLAGTEGALVFPRVLVATG